MDENPPSPISDELLARVRDGDGDAACELVRMLYPLVWTSVHRHIRAVAEQEDVAQEIYMRIFLKIDQYRGVRPFEHWASRVCVTTCYDYLRKRKIRPLVCYADLSDRELALIEAAVSEADTGEANLSRHMLLETLQKLIDTLKPREQIVIRLLDIEQRPVKEACELTGWSASKVKTTAMRARRKLAERLRRLEHVAAPAADGEEGIA